MIVSRDHKKKLPPHKGRKYRVTTQFHIYLAIYAFSSTQAQGPEYSNTVTGVPGQLNYSATCSEAIFHEISCTSLHRNGSSL